MEIALLITKLVFTAFTLVLIPFYWRAHGSQNFLWLSDIALFLTLIAFWMNSSLLISVSVISFLLPEIVWNIDFFFQLLARRRLLGVTDYMFDPKRTLFLRGLSLFHIALPILWIWGLYLWGYNKNAFGYATFLLWGILTATYFLTDPPKNINWVFLPHRLKWTWMPSWLWLMILLIGLPFTMIWPLHALLSKIMTP
ncbi:hypothetical protein [Coxiella burnetii]|uniref:hypothetical protein n=2 Tax=Coxiella burnetii TaxID=777 RepID=UPI0000ECFF5A|nr:hypothetical protein [Coxiella burnetii]ACJ20320.1 hypothetical membrane-associated protein [Coxiella burnetii CbuK_Q154]AIT63384.1 putative membrane-associated protein [Coxiella burnetii str. Namibia]ATN85962.1 hypothetical protein AYO29_05660 [Coxiella burnetii str. Schperling]EAX33189.1 hypothetical protein A35_05715 [Coxiella burnetii 'MSU Goat Q177']EDR35968.1 hypothetical protein COXBURSA334_1303 [Coxiella burnetii Q321]